MHFLWLISAGEGYELLQGAAHKGLKGLKIAPFYGCQILRPSKLLGFEDPDKPESLERIIAACGGEAIDYPAKIKCCGFPIIQAREDVALAELIQPIEQAKEAGADAMVTPCPLCHLSLDAWQSKLKKQTGKDFQMPILHLSQLIGVAAGLDGLGAQVQAPRRLGRARDREARRLSEPVVSRARDREARSERDPSARRELGKFGRALTRALASPRPALRRKLQLVTCDSLASVETAREAGRNRPRLDLGPQPSRLPARKLQLVTCRAFCEA